MISFTTIRNADGPLSKSLSLKDGKLVKAAAADLTDGTAWRVIIDSITRFADVIARLRPDEALTFGVTRYRRARVVTQTALSQGTRNAICRDRAHFAWPQGPGILMLDLDKAKAGEPLRAKAFVALMRELMPWWRGVGRFYRPSVSAFVYDADGNELSGPGSLRCYAIIDQAENIPHVGLAITDAFWRAGFGRIEFSAAGSMLVRCPVDGAVWQPERLDFAGPPVLGPELSQAKHVPLIIEGGMIDTEAAIAAGPGEISFSVWRSKSMEVRRALHAARPEERSRRTAYIEDRVSADVAAGINAQAARRKWRAAASDNVLSGDFRLYFRDKGEATVAEVLQRPGEFNLERCADPHEPTYASDNRIAQFYSNQGRGRPHIFSHAHGGVKYRLASPGPSS